MPIYTPNETARIHYHPVSIIPEAGQELVKPSISLTTYFIPKISKGHYLHHLIHSEGEDLGDILSERPFRLNPVAPFVL